MRIRQIDLVGFKSFREPTKVTLLPGLNAVVGPNGCGKSNISDAIRWVMGEQSVKHLRAKDMEDVIFGGNATSAPVNLAEVTLTFEQADEAGLGVEGLDDGLAAQIAKLSEFTVTRRIFRSGESQYLINQQAARLRDITELFMGSGVGPKAYAMIEQGRVGQIVQAKPEELRLFIEEAAGTTRFRARKIASERKLARTRENLSRVNDVMRELDRQLAALRRQAKRAEQYRLTQQELQETEIALAAHRFAALHAEREQLGSELAGLRLTLAELETQRRAEEASRDQAQGQERRMKEETEAGFSAVAESSSVVVRVRERQAATREVIASLDERVERGAAEALQLDQSNAGLEETLGEAAAQRALAGEGVETAEAGLLQAESQLAEAQPALDRAQGDHEQGLSRLNEERGAAAGAAARRAEGSARLTELEEGRSRLEERRQERDREAAAASDEFSDSAGAQEEARALHDRLEGTRQRATTELRQREDALRDLEREQSSLREAMEHVRGRLEGLKELERAYAGYAEGIGTVMALDTPPRALLVEVLEIPESLEPAAAAALGEILQGAVVDQPTDGARIAEQLRATGEGRVSLVPMHGRAYSNRMEQLPHGVVRLADQVGASSGYEGLRDALFGNVLLAEDLEAAVAAWGGSCAGYLLVTRSGDVVHPSGVVTGGRAPASADLLERRRALSGLTERLSSDEERLGGVEGRLVEARSDCARLGQELHSLDSQAHEATLALVAAEHRHDAAQRSQAAARARAAEASEELEVMQESISRAQSQAAEARVAEERAGEAVRTWEARVAASGHQVEVSRRARQESEERLEESRSRLAEAREAMTHAVSRSTQLEHEQSMVASRLEALTGETDQLRGEKTDAESSLTRLMGELEAAREELASREAAVEQSRAQARAIQEELAGCEERLAVARRRHDEQRDKAAGLESRSASLQGQIEALVGQAREQHGIAVEEAQRPEEFQEELALEQISTLRERMGRLGDVNLAAIADARELEERHEFLLTQRADLESSMEDLERTIGELSRTTRQRFKETFARANEKFGEIFVELFQGGEASLRLTNPSNLLESGVEIEAQPPGKRVGSLSVLSGGERALTAVSLIMALFSLRATPFCVLDEVDAPLDDANVARFNGMLRRMVDKTQFIVITHNQRTMESADALYGVTMADPGISQLVSVRMERADDGDQAMAATA